MRRLQSRFWEILLASSLRSGLFVAAHAKCDRNAKNRNAKNRNVKKRTATEGSLLFGFDPTPGDVPKPLGLLGLGHGLRSDRSETRGRSAPGFGEGRLKKRCRCTWKTCPSIFWEPSWNHSDFFAPRDSTMISTSIRFGKTQPGNVGRTLMVFMWFDIVPPSCLNHSQSFEEPLVQFISQFMLINS